jgi:hypothetical protein
MAKDKGKKKSEKPNKDEIVKVDEIKETAKRQISEEFEAGDEKVDKSQVISAKKVVYIEIDDEVTSVYDRVRNLKIKHIYLVVPRRAVLFQSIVNLKILKRKADDSGKSLYIITNDKNGIYLAQQVGLSVYDKVSTEGKPVLFSAEDEDEKMRITPLKASVNSVIDEAPTRRTERKLSISEILTSKRSKKRSPLPGPSFGNSKMKDPLAGLEKKESKSKQKKEDRVRKHRLVMVAPNKQALIGLAAISILILMVIFYVALPGATLYLTPAASVLEKSANVVLAEYDKNSAELEAGTPHMIASSKVSARVERTITHFATGKELSPNASSASGNITVINNANYSWPLVEATRFQTNEGLVFRITNSVDVPAASSSGPGKVDVYVVADAQDAYGQIVGERGNIGATSFFLPGLKESSRSVLHAESYVEMAGGVTDYRTYVSEEDIEAAKSKLTETLIKAVDDELEVEVVKKNDLNDTDLVLLVGDGAIWTGDVVVNPVDTPEGADMDQFEVSGYLTAAGWAYSQNEMVDLLTQELLMKKSPQKKLVRVNEDSITYRIFEKDTLKNKIKVTANIKGIEEFDIDPDKENGARLINKIREHILGKNIEDAKNYIQNLPEINKVEIDSWPAWSPTVPNVPDNIDVEVRDAVKAE